MGIGGAGHGPSAHRGTRESAGGRWGAAAPQPPRDTPAPPPSGRGEGLFFSSPFHSFQKSLILETSASRPAQPPGTLPAPRLRGVPRHGRGCGARGGFATGRAEQGSPGTRWHSGMCPPIPVHVRFPELRVGCGRAPGPRGPARLGLATEEGVKLPETTSRHSSQRHPGGISRGAWAGLESKASLPAPAGRAASPRSAPRHACRAVLSRAEPCHGRSGTHGNGERGHTVRGSCSPIPAPPIRLPPSGSPHSGSPRPAAGHQLQSFHHDLTAWPGWGAGWGALAMGLPKGAGGPPGLRGRQQGQGQGCPPFLHSHTRAHTHKHGTAQPTSLDLGIVLALGAAGVPSGEQQRGEPHACAKPPVCWHTCACLGHAQGRALVPLARLCCASHTLEHI